MRTIIALLALAILLFSVKSAKAQVFPGTLKIQNYGTYYRISVDQLPFNNTYPNPDSASLRVTVICPQSGTFEVNHLPLTGHLNYKLGGTNYICGTVVWWRGGIKKGQSNMQTLCGTYSSPVPCFQKQ